METPRQWPAVVRSLQRPDFFRIWSGLGVSQIGSQIGQVAVAYQVYELSHHSALSLGLVGAVRFVPIAVAAVVAGPLADSRDRRKLMLVTQGTLLVNSTAMAVLSWSGLATTGWVYVFVAVTGLAFAFDAPARHALVPSLVAAEELPNALSLNITVFQIASVVGPALGGVILRVGGPKLAYALDAATFAVLLLQLARIEHRPRLTGRRLELSLSAFGDGLAFLRGQPALIWLMSLDFVATFFAGSLLLLPLYADQILHVGVAGLGWLYAAPAMGAVLAALAMASRKPVERQGLVVLGSVAVYGAAIVGFGLARLFPLALLCLALSGAADTVSMVVRNTVRQMRTPDALRGRMTSLNQLFFVGGPQLGELEAGFVARLTSAPVSVISGGVACLVATALAALCVPALRGLRPAPLEEAA